MLGYDVSWAAFNIIEVMSNPRFTCKRIGYLAATQCFSEDTDVIMLCTNLIRKVRKRGGAGGVAHEVGCIMCSDVVDAAPLNAAGCMVDGRSHALGKVLETREERSRQYIYVRTCTT